jgi:hypothetical protein
VFVSQIWAQNCQTGYDIFGYNTNIVKNGSNATVVFMINKTSLPADFAYLVYMWDFGDGSPGTSQTVYPSGNYTGETHVYNLNNANIVKYGNLQVTAHLKVYVYSDYTNETSISACYTEDEYITYAIPSSDLAISLIADPVYNSYPLNKPVNLSYNIITTNYSTTDNLTFSLLQSGSEITNGSISQSDLNKNTNFYSYTPSVSGVSNLEFVVKRYGSIIGSSTLTLNITDNGGGSIPEDHSCTCTNLMPNIDVKYSISGGNINFTVTDISSSDFKNVYGTCGTYWLQVVDPKGKSWWLRGSDSGGEQYSYYGFLPYTSYWYKEPDVFDPPLSFLFVFEIPCNSSGGGQLSLKTYKTVTVPPRVFDRNENNVNLKPEGGSVTIPTHTTSCMSTIVRNPKNQPDDLSWIKNFSVGSNITFTGDANFGANERNAEITLFVSGNYDKCQDIDNGIQKPFRTIKITQKSLLKDISSDSILKIPLPPFLTNPGASYFLIMQDFGENSSNEGWYATSEFLPFFYKYYYDLYSDETSHYSILSYDKDNKFLERKDFTVYVSSCLNGMDNSAIGDKIINNDVIFLKFSNTINLESINVPINKSLTVFSTNEVNLGSNFEAPEGSLFEAEIKSCNILKKTRSSSDSSYHEQNKIGSDLNMDKPVNNTAMLTPNILVYPNPSNGSFIIENRTPDIPIKSAEIINSQGLIIKKINNPGSIQEVDVRSNSSGLYFLRISTSKGVIEKKIIINAL